MLLGNPVRGEIRPSRKFYPDHPLAVARKGRRIPLVTQDFGPSGVIQEPRVIWSGGELDLFGHRITAGDYPHFHKGLDISKGACTGDVIAAAGGRVVFSGVTSKGAELIIVGHGIVDGHRYRTLYGHLGQRLVFAGAEVEKGTLLGILGGSGELSTGCHLHFAVQKDGGFVDPWRRLRQNASSDPDAAGAALTPVTLITPDPTAPIEPPEVIDMPIPMSQEAYIPGHRAVIGNDQLGARIRAAAETDAAIIRTIPGGQAEEWRPTCWVEGDEAFGSVRWLAQWNDDQWEYTHEANVRSVTEP